MAATKRSVSFKVPPKVAKSLKKMKADGVI